MAKLQLFLSAATIAGSLVGGLLVASYRVGRYEATFEADHKKLEKLETIVNSLTTKDDNTPAAPELSVKPAPLVVGAPSGWSAAAFCLGQAQAQNDHSAGHCTNGDYTLRSTLDRKTVSYHTDSNVWRWSVVGDEGRSVWQCYCQAKRQPG